MISSGSSVYLCSVTQQANRKCQIDEGETTMMKVLMVKVRVCACLVFLLPFLCLAEVGLEDAIGVWLFDEGKGEVA